MVSILSHYIKEWKKYGTPFVAKLFSAMGDSYFKTNSVFCRIDSVFCTTKSVLSLNQLGFFSKPTQLVYRTDSIGLWNRLNSLNRTEGIEPTRLFHRTDLVFLQNQLDYFTRIDLVFFTELTWFFYRTDSVFFTEPTRLFYRTDSVFWVSFFFIINKVCTHSQL